MMRWRDCSEIEGEFRMQDKNELNEFLKTLKGNRSNMTQQQYKTIKGQAFKGDVIDARKGLQKVIRRPSG